MVGRLENQPGCDEFVSGQVRELEAWDLTTGSNRGASPPTRSKAAWTCTRTKTCENRFGFWNWLEHKEMGPAPYGWVRSIG